MYPQPFVDAFGPRAAWGGPAISSEMLSSELASPLSRNGEALALKSNFVQFPFQSLSETHPYSITCGGRNVRLQTLQFCLLSTQSHPVVPDSCQH